jgi:hypothetical protein
VKEEQRIIYLSDSLLELNPETEKSKQRRKKR